MSPVLQIKQVDLEVRNRNKVGTCCLLEVFIAAFWHIEGRKCFYCNMQECSFLNARARGMVDLCRNVKTLSKKNIYTQMCSNDSIKFSTFQQNSRIFQAIASVSPTIIKSCSSAFLSSGWHGFGEVCDRMTATLSGDSPQDGKGRANAQLQTRISSPSPFQQHNMTPEWSSAMYYLKQSDCLLMSIECLTTEETAVLHLNKTYWLMLK